MVVNFFQVSLKIIFYLRSFQNSNFYREGEVSIIWQQKRKLKKLLQRKRLQRKRRNNLLKTPRKRGFVLSLFEGVCVL